MKLSTRGRYALRMVLDLARHGDLKEPVSLAAVAERTAISRGYLEQLALTLRNARILHSVPGRHGGYLLARPADKIALGEIIEASIGPISIVNCVEDPDSCVRSESCEARSLYEALNERITDLLYSITVADTLKPSWGKDSRRRGKRSAGR